MSRGGSSRGGPVLVPQAKVRPPRTREGFFRRERLLAKGRKGSPDALVVLAPAGYGKTTFVSQWATTARRPVAWATVGEGDSDAVVLMSTLLAALAASGVALEPLVGTLTGDEPAFTRRVLPAFQRSVESLAAPVTVVVDDIHTMTGVRAAVILTALLDSLPPGSQLALVGRSRPDLPLELWLSRGRARLLGPAELAMDAQESARFVGQVLRRTPSVAEVEDVLGATHGWPVAVYLYALAIREGVSPHQPPNVVQDYLSAEVMDLLDPDLRTFLRDCAVLAEMSGPLCDATLGVTSAAGLLRQAEGTTLLVSQLEGQGGWYRMHPLLRSRFQQELDERGSAHSSHLHARAARWYDEHGFVDEAIGHATQAGNLDALGALMWTHAPGALMLGRATTVAGWLAALDQRAIAAAPGLALTAAWTAVVRAEAPAALHWAGITAEAFGPGWEQRLDGVGMEPALLLLFALSGSRGYEASAAMTAAAVEAFSRDDVVRTLAQLAHGWFCVLSSRIALGIDVLEQALREAESLAAVTSQVDAGALLAVVHIEAGAWTTAERYIAEAHRAWVANDMQDVTTSTGLLFCAAALAAARQGREAEARTCMARTEPLVTRLGPVMPWATVLVDSYAARTLALLGDDAAAAVRRRQVEAQMSRLPRSEFLESLVRATESEVAAASPLSRLTPAERRVWDHLGERLTVKELGAELYLSPDTVKTHLASIYRKLGVSSRREAQALADSLKGS